jgi:cell division transport system permease protein
MRRTFAQHIGVMRTAIRRIFNPPLAGLLNILVIGIALSLPTGMYVLLLNAHGLVDELSGTPQISVFLSLDTKADDIEKLRKLLILNPAVEKLDFVPRDEALQLLKQSTGLEDVIGGLEKNPLPDAFIVHPRSKNAQELDELSKNIATLAKVDQAQLDSAWAYKLEALLRFANLAVLILASLLSLALIAITFNTIRLQILTQREEIEVSKLIGASDSFIRRPFLYFGALQGLLGGGAAYLIVTISLLVLNEPLRSLSQLYASQFTLHSLGLGDSLSLLLFSLYLGWLGAWLSVARHLSQIEPR